MRMVGILKFNFIANAEKPQPQTSESAAKSAKAKKGKQKEELKTKPKAQVVAKKPAKQSKEKSKGTESKQKQPAEIPKTDIKLEIEPVPIFEAKIEDLRDEHEIAEPQFEEPDDMAFELNKTPAHTTSDQIVPSVHSSEPRDRRMRSPGAGPKPSKKTDADKGIAFAWYGSKQLKLIYTILHEIGDEKVINFGEFLYFYTIINEIINLSKVKGAKTVTNLAEKVSNSDSFNSEEPHFIWAFVNPQRADLVKKKVIRDVIKACVDNFSKGRKNLLDAIEEVVRNSDRDSIAALKSK